MSLTVTVGPLNNPTLIGNVNSVLADNDLPLYVEPENLPAGQNRADLREFPYSFLHYLRRFAAHLENRPGQKPEPVPVGEDPAQDEFVAEEEAMLSSHLICHSDCDGFFLPLDFREPMFEDDGFIIGGTVSSSYALMRELVRIAPMLGISLSDGILSDDEASRVNAIAREENHEFWIECAVWLCLFEAARLSIEYKIPICFV